MENEDEQKVNVNEASASIDCDTKVHKAAQNEVQNKYVAGIYNESIIKIVYINNNVVCIY